MDLARAKAWWEANKADNPIGDWIADDPVEWREYDGVPHLIESGRKGVWHLVEAPGGVSIRVGYSSAAARNLGLKEFPDSIRHFHQGNPVEDRGRAREYWSRVRAVRRRYGRECDAAPEDASAELAARARRDRSLRALESEFSDVLGSKALGEARLEGMRGFFEEQRREEPEVRREPWERDPDWWKKAWVLRNCKFASIADDLVREKGLDPGLAEYVSLISENSGAVARWIVKMKEQGIPIETTRHYLQETRGQDRFFDEVNQKGDVTAVAPEDIRRFLEVTREEKQKAGEYAVAFESGQVQVIKASTVEAAPVVCNMTEKYGPNAWCAKSRGWAKSYMQPESRGEQVDPLYVITISGRFAIAMVGKEFVSAGDRTITASDLRANRDANPAVFADLLKALLFVARDSGWEGRDAIRFMAVEDKAARGEFDMEMEGMLARGSMFDSFEPWLDQEAKDALRAGLKAMRPKDRKPSEAMLRNVQKWAMAKWIRQFLGSGYGPFKPESVDFIVKHLWRHKDALILGRPKDVVLEAVWAARDKGLLEVLGPDGKPATLASPADLRPDMAIRVPAATAAWVRANCRFSSASS